MAAPPLVGKPNDSRPPEGIGRPPPRRPPPPDPPPPDPPPGTMVDGSLTALAAEVKVALHSLDWGVLTHDSNRGNIFDTVLAAA